MREQSARHGFPIELFSDTGSQFMSKELQEFAHTYGFMHTTSSPHHPQSNGKVESAVKNAKALMRMVPDSGTDVWLAVLEFRNTPTQMSGVNSAQRLSNRRTMTLLPAKPSSMKSEVIKGIPEQTESAQNT